MKRKLNPGVNMEHCLVKISRALVLATLMANLLTAASAHAERPTLKWLTHPAIYAATGDGELIRKFEQQSGIKVEVTTMPTEKLSGKVQSALVSRSPEFDVINVADSFWTTLLARYMEPLDGLIKTSPPPGGIGDFADGFVNQFRLPQISTGKTFGIPNRMSISLLYYRKDLLKEAGIEVPRTIDELERAARKLSERGRQRAGQDFYGITFQGEPGQAGSLDWYEWASPLGVDLLVPPDWRKPDVASPMAIKALKLRRQLMATGGASPDTIKYNFEDAVAAMKSDRAAMSILYSAYWPQMEDLASSKVAGRIGYAPAPRNSGIKTAYPARGWALMINSSSLQKDSAWEFIKFLTAPEQQLWMAVHKGNPVTRLSVTRMPEFRANVPIAAALEEALPFAKTMPNMLTLPRMHKILGGYLNQALVGTLPSAEALGFANKELDLLVR